MEAANANPLATAARPDVRLVALDLDGTLLDSNKLIDDDTVAALKSACDRGVHVVIASARPPRGVRHIYQQLCLQTWQINYNGALIWDEGAGKPVFHRPMQAPLVRQIIDVSRDFYDEVGVHVEVMDKWFTDRPIDHFVTETGKLFQPDGIVCLDECCQATVTKLMLMGDAPMLMRLESLLLPRFGRLVTIVSTDSHLMQIMDARVSKAVALRKIAQHHGVQREQVMAVGDAPNDLGMLQYAGVAVAMENAHPVVKAEADWVAPHNDAQGVLAALKRFGVA